MTPLKKQQVAVSRRSQLKSTDIRVEDVEHHVNKTTDMIIQEGGPQISEEVMPLNLEISTIASNLGEPADANTSQKQGDSGSSSEMVEKPAPPQQDFNTTEFP